MATPAAIRTAEQEPPHQDWATAVSPAPLIPREVLFGNPEKLFPILAPDGRRMAYMAPVDGALNIWLKTVGQADDRPLTRDPGSNIRSVAWAPDGQTLLYAQDSDGDENQHLFQLHPASGAVRNLTPFPGVRAQLVGRSRQVPDALLVGLNRDDARFHDVYRLDLAAGTLDKVAENWGQVRQWVADAALQVRAAVASRADGGFELHVRDAPAAPWRLFDVWESDDALTSGPIGFTADGRQLILYDSRGANTTRLLQIDLTTRQQTILADDPQYDVVGLLRHPETAVVEAVAFQRERLVWQPLDPRVVADLAAIRRLAPGDFRIGSRNAADDVWLVGFWPDDGPISYYAYDRRQQAGTFLFHHQASLADYRLAAMQPIRFTARDGLHIHGYLTLPPGVPPRQLPLVLLVHGGPWARDTWGFDPQVQWLANRGYACLQVNFRGSSGYGRAFLNAGDREWGGKMQTDLLDGVRWAIDQQIADPDRIAIVGGSYGGYAALVGAAFTPDVFRCAVDAIGPVNLVTFLQSLPPHWETARATFYRRVGHPETDARFLLDHSPISRVDQIRIPLLIVQGANDPRVPAAEAEQLVQALRASGIPHDYLLFSDEGHGFSKPANRLAYYAAAERFLATHLGGRFA